MRSRRVIFDGRWSGSHGIGRFAAEMAARLPWELEVLHGAHPVSPRGLIELDLKARRLRRRTGADLFLSPGYCPPSRWPGRLAFTVHDLIHLDVPGEGGAVKRAYYERVVKPAARRADVVLTVSEFSRRRLLEWADLPAQQVVVVGDGVGEEFLAPGPSHDRGRPYVLHVGNHKPHKNLPRLVEAFALMEHRDLDLVLSGGPEPDLVELAERLGVGSRLHFVGRIPEPDLPGYYRGATCVAIPSLYEGFGLPALEAMACGVPVVAADATALPEVVLDVGVMVDPLDAASIAAGLDSAVGDAEVRSRAADRGPERAREFPWSAVAERLVRAAPGG